MRSLAAAERYCGGALRMRPVITGLHAVGDLAGVARRRGVRSHGRCAAGLEVTALSLLPQAARARPNGLVLGFGAVTPAETRARHAAARRGAGAGADGAARLDLTVRLTPA